MDRSQAAAWDPFWERLCMDSLLVCWCWLMLASVVSLRVVAVRWCWVRPAISWSAKTEVILRKTLIFSIVCWKSKNFTQSYKAKTILSCQLWFKSQTRSKYHTMGVTVRWSIVEWGLVKEMFIIRFSSKRKGLSKMIGILYFYLGVSWNPDTVYCCPWK